MLGVLILMYWRKNYHIGSLAPDVKLDSHIGSGGRLELLSSRGGGVVSSWEDWHGYVWIAGSLNVLGKKKKSRASAGREDLCEVNGIQPNYHQGHNSSLGRPKVQLEPSLI